MKKILVITLASLLGFSFLQAEGMKCGAGKCGSSIQSSKSISSLLSDTMLKDGFTVNLSSQKPLVSGNNEIAIILMQNGKRVSTAKVKIKFFMPEMPGMPYMEYQEKLKLDGDMYKGVVNLSMNGTWQYHLKFKDVEGKVHTVRGSVNI